MQRRIRVHAFVAPDHPCGYFPDRTMRAIVAKPAEDDGADLYSTLAPNGFRRSGNAYYVPRCPSCTACISLRVRVQDFAPNRRFRRVSQRNADLDVRSVAPDHEPLQHFDLYRRYIPARHSGGEMDPPSARDFSQLTQSRGEATVVLDIRLGGRLVAAAVTDVLDHGLAAVYTYFDPDLSARSLGVYAILAQIAECRRRGLAYLYLGYWIAESPKMRYKADFRPAEVLVDGRWSALD